MQLAKDPKVRDTDFVLCWHCGDKCQKKNLDRDTKRKHKNEKHIENYERSSAT